MSPEDPRHGTHRGYVIGCRQQCCTVAHTRYMKLYRMGRQPKWIEPTGTIRRIQALQALGWNCREIGQWCGKGYEWARMVTRSTQVTTTTAFTVAKVYDAMCMTRPSGTYAERTRRVAKRKGYAPPLAWDDIDDPDEQPQGVRVESKRRDLLAEWRELEAAGESIEQAAIRLGVTVGAIEMAGFRAARKTKGEAA